jgi:hypothetical protein
MKKVHLGIESSAILLGLDAGPTLIWQDDKNY